MIYDFLKRSKEFIGYIFIDCPQCLTSYCDGVSRWCEVTPSKNCRLCKGTGEIKVEAKQ